MSRANKTSIFTKYVHLTDVNLVESYENHFGTKKEFSTRAYFQMSLQYVVFGKLATPASHVQCICTLFKK